MMWWEIGQNAYDIGKSETLCAKTDIFQKLMLLNNLIVWYGNKSNGENTE